jgi:DNA-binding transcriptional ArsR family regulator
MYIPYYVYSNKKEIGYMGVKMTTLSALAEPNRYHIVELLRDGPLTKEVTANTHAARLYDCVEVRGNSASIEKRTV